MNEKYNINITLNDTFWRNYFAGQAMLAVLQESQEMRVASFWDWCKSLFVAFLHFNFLHVKYIIVPNAYEEAATRAYKYADAMLKVSIQNDRF